MDINKVNELLKDLALDHSPDKPSDAIQKIALALMHIAKDIHEIKMDVRRLQNR